jgi:hypothetical protein
MTGRSYVTDISLAGILARTPSMLLDTIRVGPNTYMGVSQARDEPWLRPRAFLERYSTRFFEALLFWPLRAWTRSGQIRPINSVAVVQRSDRRELILKGRAPIRAQPRLRSDHTRGRPWSTPSRQLVVLTTIAPPPMTVKSLTIGKHIMMDVWQSC